MTKSDKSYVSSSVIIRLIELPFERAHLRSKRLIAAAAQALGKIGDLRAMQGHLGSRHKSSLGFETFTAGGEVVKVADEDGVREAEQKLWGATRS